MDFYAILDQVIALLRQRQRVTYRALKVQFQLDDDALEALKEELIEAQYLAADEAGRILVWIGDAGTTAPASSPSAATQDCAPLTYTPPYLAEKILTSRGRRLRVNANRSPSCLPTSKTRPSSSKTSTRKPPSSSSIPPSTL
jgi:hypothetical protein